MKVSNQKIVSLVVIFLCISHIAQGFVIGIDFGSEWFKASVIRAKVFEVALNDQSSRKTATTVTLQNGELILGTDAKNLITRNPKSVYVYPNQLLGRQFIDPAITENKAYYQYPLQLNAETGGFAIPFDENITFSPETISSLLLGYAKDIATKAAGFSVKDCVIAVPAYLTQYQRQSIIDAAKLAGLNVLSLLNANVAAGIHYGIERTFENDTNVIIYDMGAASVSATLMTFRSIPDLNSKKNTTHGQVTVDEVAWDQTLGGRDFDRILAEYLSGIASKQVGEKLDLQSNPRAFAKLMKAANKAKEVLSANSETLVSVEGLLGDFDFQVTLTRETFEKLCADLFQKALEPLNQIFARTTLSKEEIHSIEIVGGGVRIPKLQQVMQEYFGRDLDRHINGDEGVVLGAAFYAATKSSSFKVKEFKVKDITPYGVSVTVKSENGEVDKSTELFRTGNRLNSKKSITFSSNENFTVSLKYEEDEKLPAATRPILAEYYVSGLPTTEKYNFTGSPKIHANFRLNSNGMIVLEDAEAEITVISIVEVKPTPANTTSNETEKTEEANTEGEATEENVEEKVEETKPEATEEAAPQYKEVSKVYRLPLKISTLSFPGITKEMIDNSDKITKEIYRRMEFKREKEREKNNLEAYIYEYREKIYTESLMQVSTEAQREQFVDLLNKAGDWLYEDGADSTAALYREKLHEVKVLGDEIVKRASEMEDRPLAATQLRMAINFTKMMMENITERVQVTQEEVDSLLEDCDEMESWLAKKLEEQEQKQPHEKPAVSSEEIIRKIRTIDTQTKVIARKPKVKPPKVETNNTIPEEKAEGQEETQTETEEKVESDGVEGEGAEGEPEIKSENEGGSTEEEKHDEL